MRLVVLTDRRPTMPGRRVNPLNPGRVAREEALVVVVPLSGRVERMRGVVPVLGVKVGADEGRVAVRVVPVILGGAGIKGRVARVLAAAVPEGRDGLGELVVRTGNDGVER